MAAPQQAQPRRAEVEFPPNVAVTVTMKYAQPRTVAGQFGERFMFSTCDNRVFFLDPEVAGQIAAQGINVREPFTITRQTDGKKGSPVTWQVARLAAAAGEQRDGTFAIPRDPDAPAPKPPARAEHATPSLVEYASHLVDAYAAVLEHALTTHQGRVKPDEVRAIFLTCAINRQKGAA